MKETTRLKMKNRINFTKITWALVALLIPAITHAHTATDSGFLHDLFHDEFHLLGGAGLLAVMAVGVWAIYNGGRALWALAVIGVAVAAAGVALGLS
ncbi:MAG: HupE/UreJ family protein [Candidatus Sedimenticola sp. (ex Thyasira tokunagai)]